MIWLNWSDHFANPCRLQSIEPRRLYRQIADQLRALIRDGEFPVGSRMPTERDLAAQLGVSRPSVREALIALEVEGLVEVRMGSGIYVTAREAPRRARARRGVRARAVRDHSARASWSKASWRPSRRAAGDAGGCGAGAAGSAAQMEADIARGVMPIRGDRLFHAAHRRGERQQRAGARGDRAVRRAQQPAVRAAGPALRRRGQSWRAAVAEHRAVIRGAGRARPRRRARRDARAPAALARPLRAEAGGAAPAREATAR